jgi:hypothetical protein
LIIKHSPCMLTRSPPDRGRSPLTWNYMTGKAANHYFLPCNYDYYYPSNYTYSLSVNATYYDTTAAPATAECSIPEGGGACTVELRTPKHEPGPW